MDYIDLSASMNKSQLTPRDLTNVAEFSLNITLQFSINQKRINRKVVGYILINICLKYFLKDTCKIVTEAIFYGTTLTE